MYLQPENKQKKEYVIVTLLIIVILAGIFSESSNSRCGNLTLS